MTSVDLRLRHNIEQQRQAFGNKAIRIAQQNIEQKGLHGRTNKPICLTRVAHMTNDLASFTESINQLINGKLILVNKNIAAVLESVAASQILTKCLADTLRTTSYATEYSRARVTWTRSDGVVVSQLKLPQDRNRLFAFVICLLAEVDSGRRNFVDFLREFYTDEHNEPSYQRFVDEVIRPFKRSVEGILTSVDPDSLNPDRITQAQKFYSPESIYIDSATVIGIISAMDDVKVALRAENLSMREQNEIRKVHDCLLNALYLKNPRILELSWIAYKNTLRFYRSAYYLLEKLAASIKSVL